HCSRDPSALAWTGGSLDSQRSHFPLVDSRLRTASIPQGLVFPQHANAIVPSLRATARLAPLSCGTPLGPCLNHESLMADRRLVSVVMPSLNQGRFIATAIDSVFAQNYQPLELIVIDGQSTDNTLEILRGYDDRIHWISEPDGGQVPALNKGFRIAKGELIGWLHAVAAYLPGALAATVAYLQRRPAIDLVYGDADYIDEAGHVLGPYRTEPFSFPRLREACFICQPATLFRRRLFDIVGLLDEGLNCSMDYDYLIRIAQRADLGYLPIRLAQSRLHAATKSSRLRREHQRASIDLVKRHFGSVPSSWLCAYATAVVEPWLPRRSRWHELCFVGAVTLVSVWESLRVNHR